MIHVTYTNRATGNAVDTRSYATRSEAEALALDAVRNAGGVLVARLWTGNDPDDGHTVALVGPRGYVHNNDE